VCEVTSGRKVAGRHLRNRSITFVEDSIGGRDSNEVDETSSLDNTVVNQEAETEGDVTEECECNNSDSIVTTEVGVGMSTRQLYDLLTNAISTLTLRRLMSYLYGAPILDVSRSHTTTQHSR